MKSYSYKILGIFLFVVGFSTTMEAQRRNPNYEKYIEQYKNLAIDHMNRHKIPASITLAQGILESGAGMSQFVKESKNHFGIKCHTEWKGERIYKDDDRKDDCFRKYKDSKDSFEDHSLFLKRDRYKMLFSLNIRDYKAWAKGLQTCGYATDKAYANKLIQLIENYELYQFDSKNSKLSNKKEEKKNPLKRSVYIAAGLLYVLAENNDNLESIASDLNFKAKDLAKYNDVPSVDFPINKGDIVYLEKKKKKADKPFEYHTVQIGESMHSISQIYGIRMSNLYKMNKKDPETFVPEEGDILKLR